MPVNLVGLGLLVAGVIFLVMGGFGGFEFIGATVLWIIGVVCLVGGIGSLFMTYQRRRRLA
jgi:drug/metabolite transporter (DMT)-like permease